MIEKVKNIIQQYSGQKIAVAVSGGVDSMVLCHLLMEIKVPFTGLHCNFQLRNEADTDEQFVVNFFEKYKIPVQTQKFNTNQLQRSGETIQMTARRLRYDWFNSWIKANNGFVLTAHHLDDRIESFWINLHRGTGLIGLQGIPFSDHGFVRPLLQLRKAELVEYASRHDVPFVYDQSNDSLHYFRNQLRHLFTPLLKDEVSYEEWSDFFERQTRINTWLEQRKKALLKRYVVFQKDAVILSKKLLTMPFILSYQVLKQFGVRKKHEVLMSEILASNTSSRFDLEGCQWLVAHDHIKVIPSEYNLKTTGHSRISGAEGSVVWKEWQVIWRTITKDQVDFEHTQALYFDVGNVDEIVVRSFQEGDSFIPFGMKGKKKVGDFLNEQKVLSQYKKEYPVLLFDNEVVGVLPFRGSERYKLYPQSTDIMKIIVQKVGF